MIVLFAALIAPFFVNWDSYKANFEREATRLAGHPVHVGGAAHVRILPSPSVTFTDVEVGEPGAEPIVTVETFSATIELLSLLQGEVRVVSMTLDRPHLRLTADELARAGWLKPPSGANRADKVVLGGVQVNDGTLNYVDREAGIALAFGGVTAAIAADSLAGPWRAEGTYVEGQRAIPFRLATGRQLEDGTIRLQADVSPPSAPVKVNADGVLANRSVQGFTYAGTYNAVEVSGDKTVPAGWRSQGAFSLSRDRISIEKAVLSTGPAERPTSVAGSLALIFGKQASFAAKAEARQIDLDRTLAGGAGQPVNVAATAQAVMDRIAAWPLPTIPGRIAFNVPGIVVGGSVIQDASFVAEVASDGWKLTGLRARLPGQALVEADGMLSLRRGIAFSGHAHLAAAQPGALAAWWRGGGGAASVAPAFDIAGDATLAEGRVDIDRMVAHVGVASVSGRVSWGVMKDGRALSTDLKADRLNFADLKGLAELAAGHELSTPSAIADSYSVRLAADSLQVDTTVMKGVSIDASYTNDTLNVVQLAVSDLGDANFRVTSGRIDALTSDPRGHLDAKLEAPAFDALIPIVRRLLPDSGAAEWLARTAPVLSPAVVNARITAPPQNGSGFQLSVDGVAGDTTFKGAVQSAVGLRGLEAWRITPAVFSVELDSPDSAELAQQLGFAATQSDGVPGARLTARGNGVPKDGLDSVIDIDLAGVTASAQGKLAIGEANPSFAGTFTVNSEDVAALIATAGLSIPGAANGTPIALAGAVNATGADVSLTWKDGKVAGFAVAGNARIARLEDHTWRVGGDLDVDEVDLGWLASLGLGRAPQISDDPKSPWSKAEFTPPTYGPVNGKLTVTTDHFHVGDLDITGGKLALALQPNRIDADLSGGSLAGGAASGGVSIQNVDGGATLAGQFNLTGAALDEFTWRQDGKPILTGGVDVSANFEATGRTPAALASSITGGGVIAIHDGVVHNLNAATGQAIVRLADLGEPFSEAGLKDAVADQIDRDALPFGEAGGAFTIAGGTVRASGIAARAPGADLTGNLAIDLGMLQVASDWSVTFSSLEPVAGGGDPKIGVSFHGPLAAPVRTIDALPLNSYLSTRQASRMLQVIATEEADRAEHQRLQQQIAKIKDDAARVERARQAAIEAARRRTEIEAAATARIAAAHTDREIAADENAAARLKRAADLDAAAAASAKDAAEAAAVAATAARGRSDQAQAMLASSVQADAAAAAVAANAKAEFEAAEARAAATAEAASNAANAAAAAADAARAAAATEARAKADADRVAASRSAANAALDAANAKARNARAAADAAVAAAEKAKVDLDSAGRAVSDALRARDSAAQALASASAALAPVATLAEDSANRAKQSAQAATEADAERARYEMLARQADDERRRAQDELDAARADVASTRQQYEMALAELNMATQSDATGTSLQSATRRSQADHLKQMVDIAEGRVNTADMNAGMANTSADRARADADVAIGKAQGAAVEAQQAAASDASTQARLRDRTAERDAAAADVQAREADAQRAGVTFNAAETEADKARERAAQLVAAAAAAEAEQSKASTASAVSSAAPEGFALDDARKKRVAATDAAESARATADSAQSVALAASQALTTLRAAYEAAHAAANAAHAARIANEQAAQAAQAAAVQAEANAVVAADRAAQLAVDAEGAARRVQPVAVPEPKAMPTPPQPRQRPKPAASVPDYFAGDGPLLITPPAQ